MTLLYRTGVLTFHNKNQFLTHDFTQTLYLWLMQIASNVSERELSIQGFMQIASNVSEREYSIQAGNSEVLGDFILL